MKAALLIVLSLSAVAFAGPAFNKNNQISQQQQQQNYMTGDVKSSPAVETLKQWCFSSQMSQQELTASFKKLVGCVKSAPVDLATESAVMSGRICQGALVQKTQSGSTVTPTEADAKAHELIKDVYMDALISCKSRECTQQLLKVIGSQQVDTIRAAYYMTRIAVSDKQSLKGEQEIKQFVESFVEQQQQEQHQTDKSEAVERQKLFATTALIAKWAQQPQSQEQELKQVAEQVVKTIVERYIKPVSEQEIEQYKQQQQQQQQQTEQPELAKKIAKRSAALKALANIPGHVLKRIPSAQQLEQLIVKIAKDERELSTVRQSAIECLEQNDKQKELLKELTFDQEQPIEVRIAAYRALMTVAYEQDEQQEKNKEQMVEEIIEQLVKHCEQKQQTDEQFVLYVVSHLDNVRASQQPEVRAVKQAIAKNKQHYMQVQVLAKKLAQKLADVRSSSRNYKLEQEFDQINSGLVLEGDLIYESKHKQQQQVHILPKLIRVNMSMPIMGESVNVVEVTVRQNQMDESILAALKLAQSAKFNSESVAKVVDSFKSSVEKQTYAAAKSVGPVEADLTIKVDGCTVVYMSVDDIKAFKTIQTIQQQQHQRNTRSAGSQSLVEELVELLKRAPINFNRGFNVNINERLAKVLDVDANMLAGLRFESRAQGDAKRGDFELAVQMEPRFSFEAIVGPSSPKVSSKKLLQRVSTKTALGLRLRFKKDELVDIQLDLPMNNMELFTVETQLVEKNTRSTPYSYNYLPESIYGDEDIYAPVDYSQTKLIAKRSIFGQQQKKQHFFAAGKQFAHTYETGEQVARASGLRAKLRVVAAPNDLSFLVGAQLQKVEPQMQGFRVKLEKSQRQGEQWTVSVSTPNSRVERTTELRIVKQLTGARSIVKCEIPQSPFTSGPVAASIELIHDGRQYAVKSELVSQGRQQWRHQLDAGLVSAAQSAAGRLAQFAYKPYVSIQSTSLKRPISLQGQLAFVQSPKSVISYELKCSTTGDFVQGKLIVDQRDVKMSRGRRSMRSPIELLLEKDLTFTNELLAQVQSRALKVHQMAEWSCQQFALKADSQVVSKNLRKASQESRTLVSMKLDQEQQVFQVERKSAADARNDFTARLVSIVRQNGHQMELETRQHNQPQSLKAYKHKVDIVKVAPKKYEAKVEVELVDSERAINEKLAGRARVSTERQLKAVEAELQSRTKQAKLSAEFVSLAKHQIVVALESERYSHKCELRNNERQLYAQSRTQDKRSQQMLAKLMLDCQKQQQEAKLAVELADKQLALAADLKLQSGKRSSLAIQTGRFASQLEFSFETYARAFAAKNNKFMGRFAVPATMRLRSNLKDLEAKQTYWMDSELSADQDSFIRLDSPIYRTDFEFSPRELQFKLGAFARNKRSVDHFDAPLYSTKDSALFGLGANSLVGQLEQLKLSPNKMWMLRSIVASPYAREALKQKARRALFEYADKRATTRHSMNWAPEEQRLSMDFVRQPAAEFAHALEPMQAKAELATGWSRPSTVSLSSQWMDVSAEMNPAFDSTDDSDAYARIVALSRHPRSAFKKHESEFRYNKRDGYKAHMKHQDAKSQEHKFQLEADAEPRHWAKLAYESDKHGKTNWQHQWRKQQAKRQSAAGDDTEQVYANQFQLNSEGPANNKWQHQTRFDWQEPIYKRQRRSYNADKFAPIDYLKHTNGRLVSSGRRAQSEQPMYQLDFDYQPQMQQARLNVDMPEENMIHSSEFQYKPSESLYKLTSKYLNRLTQEPSYEFALASKPFGLATGDQEPMFFAHEHEMYERPIGKQSLGYQLFKQPLKLDYSDKFGRIATIDYDTIPTGAGKQHFAGLRQKRAAVYYKDQANDFQHSTSYDFYPEAYMAKMKPTYYKQQQQPEIAFKTETKFGPVVVRADSDESARMVAVESPLMNAKLSAETFESSMRQLVKLQLDNKSQRVQLAKIVRDSCPEFVRDCKLVKKFVRKFDSGHFEHQSELLVSLVESIFKIKSASKFNQRPIVVIEGEWNSQQNKAQLKVNGERVEGHAIVDLVRKNAELVLDVDQKHTMHHVTRMVRTSDQFYSIESATSCKSRPVFKLVGKVSAMLFDLEHVFSRRQQYNSHAGEHLSTFEAVVYEPKEMHITGQFDCDKKEARVVFKNVDEQRIQETFVRFEQPTETIIIDSRLSGQREGQIYAAKAKLSLPGLYQSGECSQFAGQYKSQMMSSRRFGQQQNMTTRGPQSCQSEMIYADNQSGSTYAMKYMPGEYVTIESPRAQQFINLAKYYHQY